MKNSEIDVNTLGWYVWNHERGMWWRPGKRGYTENLLEAGVYLRHDMIAIARDGNNYGITTSFVPALNYPFQESEVT